MLRDFYFLRWFYECVSNLVRFYWAADYEAVVTTCRDKGILAKGWVVVLAIKEAQNRVPAIVWDLVNLPHEGVKLAPIVFIRKLFELLVNNFWIRGTLLCGIVEGFECSFTLSRE